MTELIGYAGVSTKADDADRQIHVILAAGVRREDLDFDHDQSGPRAKRQDWIKRSNH